MKPSRASGLDGGGLALTQQHSELADGATEPQHERLRALAGRPGVLQRALLLEPRELGGRAAEARERERRPEAAAPHRDAPLPPLEPAPPLGFEGFRGPVGEPP